MDIILPFLLVTLYVLLVLLPFVLVIGLFAIVVLQYLRTPSGSQQQRSLLLIAGIVLMSIFIYGIWFALHI